MVKFKEMKKVGRKVKFGFIAGLLALTAIPFADGYTQPQKAYAAIGTPGGTPDYWTTPNYANSPLPEFDPTTNQIIPGTGIRKFVDTLPGLGAKNANDLGQYIPVAIPDTTTYPGSDYYEISLVQYTQQMHKDLKATTLRGYEQTNTADPTVANHPSIFGPVIIAKKNRPVRIKFTNKLSTGSGGDLFLPVDTSIMGAGMGPDGKTMYTQNRATLHLHGGITPWISDGTPHQWITPAGENTPYPKGVSVRNVPDMPDPGPGSMTFFYTNQQSARLMFFHDHSYGITRLNIYAGEAAGYMITDDVEQDLINRGVIPDDNHTIPLFIQDKTFVPKQNQLDATDPTWDTTKWGGLGQLWFPHVYMPNQNPYDMSGANPMGRWDYGPWFWPPNTGLKNGPVPNPLAGQTGQAPMNPGVPNISAVPEAFMDTPVVNGTAYPVLNVDPRTYRFKILNASNDRMWNLQFYKAKSNANMWNADGTLNDANAGEVPMVPAVKTTGFPTTWPTDGRDGGVPDPNAAGPDMFQIGNDSGFLPNPVDLKSQPIDYEYNRRIVTALNVTSKELLLGPAERADVVVDFSKYAGQTLILYNDAAAPLPGFDPRYDYYTNDPDQSATGNNSGGAPTTQPGYGPNTRTIMMIKVAPATASTTDTTTQTLNTLSTEIPAAFSKDQNPLIFPNSDQKDATGTVIKKAQWVNIQDTSATFTPPGTTTPVTMNFQPKAIAEEFETNYGRMNATLGTEMPNTNFQNQTTIMLGYVDPTTENMTDSIAPIGQLGDGTQIWKISHNGVDTHAIHFHLFDVQVINRIGWDGSIRMPDPNEMGWKDTVRMNPLEDCIIALRPVAPKLPFGIPDSIRLLDPTSPVGSTGQFANVDPLTNNPITVTNQMTNFGWEYVWHCHLLGHEENDMMRSYHFSVKVVAPDSSVLTEPAARVNGGPVNLTWTDPTPVNYNDITTFGNPKNEVGYNVMRAPIIDGKPSNYTKVAAVLANNTTYTDTTADPNTDYKYRIDAFNAATDPSHTSSTPDPNTMYNSGTPSNEVTSYGLPAAPTNLIATVANKKVSLIWTDNATNETNFVVERSTDGTTFNQIATVPMSPGTGLVTYNDTSVNNGTTYTYRVKAVGASFSSAYSNTVQATPKTQIVNPNSPSNLKAVLVQGPDVNLTWLDNATNESGYIIQRSTDGGKTFTLIGMTNANPNTGYMSYTDISIVPGTTYTYLVTAFVKGGGTSNSHSTTIDVLLAPTNVSGTAISGRTTDSLSISWKGSSGTTGYVVQVATDSAFTKNVMTNNVGSTSTATNFIGLTKGISYYYRIQAVYPLGSSPWYTSTGSLRMP